MKNSLHISSLLVFLIGAISVQGQTRYLDQIFDSQIITEGEQIGFNVDALRSDFGDFAGFQADMNTINGFIEDGDDVPLNFFVSNSDLPDEQETVAKLFPIEMDIYTPPAEDTETNRPLIVYIHTGNFLPPIVNGGPGGSRKDSVVVNLCKQWAQKGYVVAALSYRLGWNPISEDPDVRRGTLLQAVYRAIHDTQTAVRYMRSTAAQGNPYGINPEQVALFGQGSGGYVAQAYATLDDYNNEIAIPKFIGDDGLPYVLEAVDGGINGEPGAIRLPDPLQQAGISKEVSMSVNMGGALADISWLEEGDAPMVTIHCIRDPFAPFDDGTVVVPTTNEDVVDVSGGNVFIQQAVDFGNNSVFASIPDGNDVFTDRARELYGQTYEYILGSQPEITVAPDPEGLLPLLLPINTIDGNRFTNEGSPWDWWDFATLEQVVAATNAALGSNYDANQIHQQSLAGNPGMGSEKGLAYIDTIQGYVNPRMMCVFEFEGNPCALSTDETELDRSTNIFPNPAQNSVSIQNDEFPIRRVELYDITGRLIAEEVVNNSFHTFQRGNMNDGVYLMQIIFDNQRITKKVMFN